MFFHNLFYFYRIFNDSDNFSIVSHYTLVFHEAVDITVIEASDFFDGEIGKGFLDVRPFFSITSQLKPDRKTLLAIFSKYPSLFFGLGSTVQYVNGPPICFILDLTKAAGMLPV